MSNLKAIVVYLDNSDKAEIELTWLYKTWVLYSLEDEFDLVVYYNPSAKSRVKNFKNIKSIEMPYIRMAEEYKFLNSHYFCTKNWNEPLKKYKFIFKTDCDVFLTENIKGYTPSKLLIGEGGYYSHGLDQKNIDEKINFIKNISSSLGYKYNHMSIVGASFFGKAETVVPLVSIQSEITEELLKNHLNNNNVFDRGIASMIAGEIVVNGLLSNQHISLYCIDSRCWESTKIGSDILHIHAWHTGQKWSKHQFFDGKYSDWKVNLENAFENAANYCHWIATTPIEDIELLKISIKDKTFRPNYKLLE